MIETFEPDYQGGCLDAGFSISVSQTPQCNPSIRASRGNEAQLLPLVDLFSLPQRPAEPKSGKYGYRLEVNGNQILPILQKIEPMVRLEKPFVKLGIWFLEEKMSIARGGDLTLLLSEFRRQKNLLKANYHQYDIGPQLLTLAYLAGYFDSYQGSINNYWVNNSLVCQIVKVNHSFIMRLHEQFGGVTFMKHPKNSDLAARDGWRVAGQEAEDFLGLLIPHLRLRHDELTNLVWVSGERGNRKLVYFEDFRRTVLDRF